MCKVHLVALYTDRQTHTDEYNLKVRHSTLRTVTNSFTLRDRNQINASFFPLYFNSSISVTKTNITGRGIIKVHLLLVVKFISLLLVYTTVHKQTHIAHPLNESFRGGGVWTNTKPQSAGSRNCIFDFYGIVTRATVLIGWLCTSPEVAIKYRQVWRGEPCHGFLLLRSFIGQRPLHKMLR